MYIIKFCYKLLHKNTRNRKIKMIFTNSEINKAYLLFCCYANPLITNSDNPFIINLENPSVNRSGESFANRIGESFGDIY